LVLELAGIAGRPGCFFKDNLANSDAGVDCEWDRADIGHFENLFAVHARLDKVGGCVNGETYAGELAFALNPAAEVVGEGNCFDGNAMDGFAGKESEGILDGDYFGK